MSKIQLSITVEPYQIRNLKKIAKTEKRSVSGMVQIILDSYFESLEGDYDTN